MRSLLSGLVDVGLACQVVPDIPTFAVDDGFTYTIPEGMPVVVGSQVRIRVSGRRLSGFVTAVFPVPEGRKLLPVDGVRGNAPVFDETLLDVCRWTSTHYVAPLSTVLKRTSPPNVPRSVKNLGTSLPRGASPGVTAVVSAAPHTQAILDELARSVRPVIVPSAVEAADVAAHVRATTDHDVVVATSSMSGAAVTRAWARAAHDESSLLVGTREVALWPVINHNGWIVVEDGRRVMKSPSTPTLHVREIAAYRSRITDGHLTLISPVPTLESLHLGAQVVIPAGREWSAIEVVDRTEEPPGSSLLTNRVRHAVVNAVAAGQKVFVLVTARGYAPAFRCLACSELRVCQACGTHATGDETCRRCGEVLGACKNCGGHEFAPLGAGIGRMIEDLARFVDRTRIGGGEDGLQVAVGSERDLVGLGGVGLGVVVDFDGMTGAPHYRATEDTLRLIARLAQATEPGRSRVMVQTSRKDQPLLRTLVAGHAKPFLDAEAELRERAGFPPFGSLIAIEIDVDHEADTLIREAVGEHGVVRGPARMRDRQRWLIQGPDLDQARIGLRSAVGTLRSQGARVRVDADPIDL